MAYQDAEVETLTCLGLTHRQAKVYLTLAQSGTATVRTISKVSEVPRQHIYQAMSALQELSLVEKAVTAPIKFTAISIPEALSILMERKSKEYNEIQAKTMTLLKNSIKNNAKATPQEEKPQFVMIPRKDATDHWARKRIENTQTSLDALISWEIVERVMYSYARLFKKALKRGVKFRQIFLKPEDEKLLSKIDPALKKNPNFKIKYVLTRPPAAVTLWDKKEAFVSTVPADPILAPGLWSNNPGFVAIIQDYFELMWLTALEETPKNTNPVTSY